MELHRACYQPKTIHIGVIKNENSSSDGCNQRKKIVDTFSDAVKAIPLLGEDRNDTEYRRALALVEFLVDQMILKTHYLNCSVPESVNMKNMRRNSKHSTNTEKTPLAFQYCERSWINTVSKQQILPTNSVQNRTSATS